MNATAQGWRVEASYGALTALKWLALALMVVDHVDAFVFARELTWAGQVGRLVFPLFAFVVAYNLARPDAMERGVHRRMLVRLAVAGICAAPFHAWLRGDLLPLNIMATFMLAVGVAWSIERRQWPLVVALLAVSPLVEYGFPGVVLVASTWLWLRWPSMAGFGAVGLALGSLALVNGSHAAMWALPVVVLALQARVTLPRCQSAFYAFYPAHLALFWMFM